VNHHSQEKAALKKVAFLIIFKSIDEIIFLLYIYLSPKF